MFATYLTLAQEACEAVKAHKERLVGQVAHILADGVKQGAFQVADVNVTARAVFDATTRYHHPAHSDEWKRSGDSRRGSTRCWRCCSRAWKRREALERVAQLSVKQLPHPSLISVKSGADHGSRGGKSAACGVCGYPCQPAGVLRLPRGRAGAGRGADRLPRRHRRIWRRSGMGGRYRDGSRREGAIAVRGNHDNAIGIPSENMNAEAQAAIEWTRGRLSAPQRRFLAELPLTRQEDDRLYVHSEAVIPRAGATCRARRMPRAASRRPPPMSPSAATSTSPALYSMSAAAKMTSFVPTSDVPVQLLARPALARRARLGRAAARRQSGGGVCDVRYGDPRDHLLPRALRRRGGGGPDSRQRPAALAGRSPVRPGR